MANMLDIPLAQLDYTDSRDLGSGSGGSVTTAWWTPNGDSSGSGSPSGSPTRIPVAVKRMHGSSAPTADDLDRFGHTFALLHSLQHDNIVRVFGVCTESGGGGDSAWSRRSLVTEMLDTNMADLIKKHTHTPCISDRTKAEILVQVAEGLHYLHTHNPALTHRDVKPSNVGLSLTPQLRVKLLDFDAVSMDQQVSGRSAMAPSRRGGGTQLYQGPELYQPSGAAAVGPFNDVFSFALLACELFGQHPWSALQKTEAQIVSSYLSGRVPPVPDCVPPPLRPLLERCMQHAHMRRPKIQDVVAELKHVKARLADTCTVPRSKADPDAAARPAMPNLGAPTPSASASAQPAVFFSSAQVSPHSLPMCVSHAQPCNFFCTRCKELRCHVCRMEGGVEQRLGHSPADVPLVETLAPLEIDNLRAVRREADAFANKYKQSSGQTEQIQQQKQAVLSRAARTECAIESAFARLHEYVEKRKAAVMEHQRRCVASVTGELDTMSTCAETLHSQVPHLLSAIDHALAQPPAQLLLAAASPRYEGFTGGSVAVQYEAIRGALQGMRSGQQAREQRQQREAKGDEDWSFDDATIVRELKRFGVPHMQS